MADLDITQAEADALIAMEKHRADDKDCLFPEPGGRLTTRDNALLFINAWGDTRQVRATDSKAYAVLNDEQPIADAVIEAFRNSDIRPVPWTQRIDVLTELAA